MWTSCDSVEALKTGTENWQVPMEEVPDQELEVTSSKLKPARTEACCNCRSAVLQRDMNRSADKCS